MPPNTGAAVNRALLVPYPELAKMVVCPSCGWQRQVFFTLDHLFCDEMWSRERCADWLDTVLGVPLELPARRYATYLTTFSPITADLHTRENKI